MILLALAPLGLLVLLLGRASYHHAALRREWEFVTGPWAATAMESMQAAVAAEAAALDGAYKSAMRARAAGSRDEALRMLDVGLHLTQKVSPDWLTLLRAVSLLARMADAVTPIPPLRPMLYRWPALGFVTLLGTIAHHITITAGERLRLRAYVLRGGWRIVRSGVSVSTANLHRRDSDRDWQRLEAIRADLATLADDSVGAFHAVLLSMSAAPARSKSVATAEGR
jgi:hypothetical protein